MELDLIFRSVLLQLLFLMQCATKIILVPYKMLHRVCSGFLTSNFWLNFYAIKNAYISYGVNKISNGQGLS